MRGYALYFLRYIFVCYLSALLIAEDSIRCEFDDSRIEKTVAH